MQRRGPGLPVQLILGLLVLATLAMALVQPVQAGTVDDPEIVDAHGDQKQDPSGTSPCPAVCPTLAGTLDLRAGWLSVPTAETLLVSIENAGGPHGQYSQSFTVDFVVGATAYQATAFVGATAPEVGSGGLTVGGVASSGAYNGTVLELTVPMAAIGNPPVGTVVSGYVIQLSADFLEGGVYHVTDRAPDDGVGRDFPIPGGVAPDANDTDGDGLNDTCETSYFGGLNSTHNATEDADGDGLTNAQECQMGTDPTKADTDGDGVDDKDDPFPTDPSKGGASNSTTTHSTTSTSGSRTSTTSRSTTTTTAAGSDSGSVTDLAGAIDKLQSDAGYLGMSAGGLLAVLVLCIIGLAVRWSL